MTVKQLIAELEQIEDKDSVVAVWDSVNKRWTDHFDLYPEKKEMWSKSGYYKVTRTCLDCVIQ